MDGAYARGQLFGLAGGFAASPAARPAAARPAARLALPDLAFVRDKHQYFDLVAPVFICVSIMFTLQKLTEAVADMKAEREFGARMALFVNRHALFFSVCGLFALAALALLLAWFVRTEDAYQSAAVFAAPRIATCAIAGTLPVLVAALFIGGMSTADQAPAALSRGVYGTASALIALQVSIFIIPAIYHRIQKA
jgi:hypothetical protein